jgi:Proteasome-substrate-size regulator, mid region
VRYWCQNIHQRDLQIKWHIPDEDEIDFAQELIREFLEPALEKLKSHGDGTQPLERKELEKTLLLVEMFVSGAAILFPFDSDPAHQMLPCETTVKIYSDLPDPLISLSARELYIADQPARQYLFDVIQPVLQKISVADEDDVKSIKIILKIFRSLMFYRGLENEELQTRIKAHIVTWKQLSRMLGHRHHQLRLLMFERVNIQHLRRHYVCMAGSL